MRLGPHIGDVANLFKKRYHINGDEEAPARLREALDDSDFSKHTGYRAFCTALNLYLAVMAAYQTIEDYSKLENSQTFEKRLYYILNQMLPNAGNFAYSGVNAARFVNNLRIQRLRAAGIMGEEQAAAAAKWGEGMANKLAYAITIYASIWAMGQFCYNIGRDNNEAEKNAKDVIENGAIALGYWMFRQAAVVAEERGIALLASSWIPVVGQALMALGIVVTVGELVYDLWKLLTLPFTHKPIDKNSIHPEAEILRT